MDAQTLIREWPSLARANAETIFRSPAWRMSVKFAGTEQVLKVPAGSTPGADELVLAVTIGEERHLLGIDDTELFPDLHALWSRRAELDSNLVLALVERECGPLFELVEAVTRREFAVIGLAEASEASRERTVFRLDSLAFSLDVTAAIMLDLGRLENLDPTHEAIRSLTRPARYRYASVTLPDDAAPAPGDMIVMTGFEANTWLTELPDGQTAQICAFEEEQLPFAAFADDALPQPKDDQRLVLVRDGRIVADGEFSRLGDVRCFKLIHLHS